jgi:hypothetical protein
VLKIDDRMPRFTLNNPEGRLNLPIDLIANR